jgi:hypothetical protein
MRRPGPCQPVASVGDTPPDWYLNVRSISLRVKLRILTLMTAAEADSSVDADVDTLLSGLTRFLLLHSAEGAFELRDTVRGVGRAYGADAEILAIAEGAVLTVRHPAAPSYYDTVRGRRRSPARRGHGPRRRDRP